MVQISWIDTIYEGETMLLQAYDENGNLVFDKKLKATLKEAEETANNISRGNLASEFYNYSD